MSADFIDSNIFVYLFDETDSGKRHIAEELIHVGLVTGTANISFQVIQEILNVLTSKLKPPVSQEDARHFMDQTLIPLWRIMPSQRLYHRSLDIQVRYRYSFYDALIIAAALDAGCNRLYSEDLQHGQQIEDLTIENPFSY